MKTGIFLIIDAENVDLVDAIDTNMTKVHHWLNGCQHYEKDDIILKLVRIIKEA